MMQQFFFERTIYIRVHVETHSEILITWNWLEACTNSSIKLRCLVISRTVPKLDYFNVPNIGDYVIITNDHMAIIKDVIFLPEVYI